MVIPRLFYVIAIINSHRYRSIWSSYNVRCLSAISPRPTINKQIIRHCLRFRLPLMCRWRNYMIGRFWLGELGEPRVAQHVSRTSHVRQSAHCRRGIICVLVDKLQTCCVVTGSGFAWVTIRNTYVKSTENILKCILLTSIRARGVNIYRFVSINRLYSRRFDASIRIDYLKIYIYILNLFWIFFTIAIQDLHSKH